LGDEIELEEKRATQPHQVVETGSFVALCKCCGGQNGNKKCESVHLCLEHAVARSPSEKDEILEFDLCAGD
jgi:hypothetical protein